MNYKKTDNCCRVCRHYGWGLIKKGQIHETRVCLQKPKLFKDNYNNWKPHFYAADPCDYCEKFEKGVAI